MKLDLARGISQAADLPCTVAAEIVATALAGFGIDDAALTDHVVNCDERECSDCSVIARADRLSSEARRR